MEGYIIVSTSTDLVRARVDEVVFVSSDGNYSTIVFVYGESRVLTLQLGQLEQLIGNQLHGSENVFIRIGKSLIINRRYISYIHPSKQQLVLSDGRSSSHTLSASREALKQLKELIERDEL